jgi:hypothetical protein
MSALDALTEKLRAKRFWIVVGLVTGVLISGALIALAPSQIGFVLAGPLVIFPWGLLCIAFARRPSAPMVAFFAVLAMCGLAWPLLYI